MEPSDKELKSILIERLDTYRAKMREAEREQKHWQDAFQKWSQAAQAAESMLSAEGISVPPEVAQTYSPKVIVTTNHGTHESVTGLAKLGFRDAVMKILEHFPNGARAPEIADVLKKSDYKMPDLQTDLATRVANDCARLIKQGRLLRPERGLFILPKHKKDPTADTEGSLFSSTNGYETDADGTVQQGGY